MNKKLTVSAVFAVMLLSCAAAFADSFGEVMKRAEAGDAKSQLDIAVAYFQGEYVKENHEEAAKWYLKATEQGYADAQCDLGVCYTLGRGVEKDLDAGFKWLNKAAT